METATAKYRKTSQGEWVVQAPASALHAGSVVTVTKANGETKTETIARVGRSFTAGGIEMAYGYIAKPAHKPSFSSRYGRGVSYNDAISLIDGDF